jgi:Rrf2 family iron-sulfur cluster assembly transcriptional regulator
MRLSTKGRYAVMAMTDLAAHAQNCSGRGAVALAEIAERQQISLAYLEQLFARLRRKGVVDSVRGPGGGYRLAKPAAETSIAEIVRAVDEPLKAVRCTGEGKLGCLKGGQRCATHALWDAMGRNIEAFLAGVSLDDVLTGKLNRETA